ncbi:MAG TPA: hypothetical protein VKU38_16640 [Ktedonobacteraceae bacterium]|nr:hypothetical protein [Ktedonobacteraceae bacterium]
MVQLMSMYLMNIDNQLGNNSVRTGTALSLVPGCAEADPYKGPVA